MTDDANKVELDPFDSLPFVVEYADGNRLLKLCTEPFLVHLGFRKSYFNDFPFLFLLKGSIVCL